MTQKLIPPLAAVWFLALAGCNHDKAIDAGDAGDSGGDSGDSGDSGSDRSCTDDAGCPDWQICESTVCVDGDRNNSVGEAETLLWEDTVSGIINPKEDVDYFTFAAEGGEMVKLSVASEYEDANTVMVLRKANGKVVSMADEFATETSVSGADSVVFGYLAEAGDYVVSIGRLALGVCQLSLRGAGSVRAQRSNLPSR